MRACALRLIKFNVRSVMRGWKVADGLEKDESRFDRYLILVSFFIVLVCLDCLNKQGNTFEFLITIPSSPILFFKHLRFI